MRVKLSAVMVLAVFACGCAFERVRVTGYLETGADRAPGPGASIHVMENESPANRLFDREIALKIERLLEMEGYRLGSPEESDFVLSYSYGVGGAETFTESAPMYSGATHASAEPSGYSYSGWGTGGQVTHVPYTRTVYRKWLVLKVAHGAAWRQEERMEPVWVAEASSTDSSTDMRERINYLLAALFEYFGRDTGKQVTVDVERDDPRVEAVRNF